MKFKALIKKILENIDGVMFDKGLTCNLCGREVFHREDFCKDCLDTIDFNDGPICSCCGRKTPIATKRCDSCKGEWAVDLARSAFTYRGGAEGLIKALKYGGKQYLAEVLAPYLKQVYVENYFAPDFINHGHEPVLHLAFFHVWGNVRLIVVVGEFIGSVIDPVKHLEKQRAALPVVGSFYQRLWCVDID